MRRVRKSSERGYFDHGWLKTHHTFSFSQYQDIAHMRFRTLRVMNEDWVAPGQGFGTHPHQDMEIVTYVLEGALEHRDSMGNGEELRPGEFQRMSAGTGITHSEFNPSTSEPVHLYQIWLYPQTKGITPSYEQKSFPVTDRDNRWQLVASPDGKAGALQIHQSAEIYLGNLGANHTISYQPRAGHGIWLQILRGEIQLDDIQLTAGDGISLEDEGDFSVKGIEPSELMLFDLA